MFQWCEVGRIGSWITNITTINQKYGDFLYISFPLLKKKYAIMKISKCSTQRICVNYEVNCSQFSPLEKPFNV